MKQIKINKTNYLIPTCWDEINLNIFLKLKELETHDKEDFFEYSSEYVSLLTGISKKDIRDISAEQLNDIFVNLSLLTNSNLNDMSEAPIFKYNKKTYVFNKDTIYGQYIDLDSFVKGQEVWNVAHKIASIFMQEARIKWYLLWKKILGMKLSEKDYKKKKYDHDKTNYMQNIFYEHMPMPMIYFFVTFFLTLDQRSNGIFKYSIQKEDMTTMN